MVGPAQRGARRWDYGRKMAEDGIIWNRPPCPDCGREMRSETLANELGIRLIYICPDHGIMSIADPLE